MGSNLANKLINKGESVICIDNLSTGNLRNLEGISNNSRFTFINHDLIHPINLKVDKIWHLACPASPMKYQEDPIQTSKTCFLGTMNMLDLAKNNGAKFLFASSSEVYGDPKEYPQSETYLGSVNFIGKRSCYTEGKRMAESLCSDFQRKYNLDVKIARIFNTYGPKMTKNDGRLISNLLIQAISNQKLTIYGDGSQTRSFCYIDDLTQALIRLMTVKYYLPVNLGNPDELSIYELAIKILQMLNKQIDFISFREKNKDDPQLRKPEISLARQILDWNPEVNLDFGLNKTIEYFKQTNTEIKNV